MLVICSMVGNVIASYGIFLPWISAELGFSRSALAVPFTAFWIVAGLLGPVAGISTVKFGPRINMVCGNLMIVLGMLGMSRATEVWHIFFFFSVFIGAGQAFGSFIAANTIITNWFTSKRALVISLLSAAGGIGGLLFPPLTTWFISSQSWQLAWIYVACIHLLLAVIISGMLIRNRPEELGQKPYGETPGIASETETTSPATARTYQTPVDWAARDVLRTGSFWLMVTFGAATMFTVNFLSLHQVAYLQDKGFTPMIAATVIGVMSAMSIVGQLSNGALGNKFEGRYLAVTCIISIAIGITILMNVRILPLIYLHTVITGIGAGGMMVITPIMTGAYYGRANYAKILGWTTPVITFFSAGSPLLAGFIFDSTGSYTPVFIIALSFLAVGLISAFFARPPKPREMAGNY